MPSRAWGGGGSRRPPRELRPVRNDNPLRPPVGVPPAEPPPTTTTYPLSQLQPTLQPRHRHSRGERSLHVRRVPEDTWRRARVNSQLSGLSLREFVIAVLDMCEPLAETARS